MKALKNNPLERMISTDKETQLPGQKNTEDYPEVLPEEMKREKEQKSKAGRKRKGDIVREKGSQQGLNKEDTRVTFIMKCAQVERLKDIAYTERKTLKEVMEEMAARFIREKETEYQDAGKEILKR